jgi:FMN phosphatase YigB (HAD superfamily)
MGLDAVIFGWIGTFSQLNGDSYPAVKTLLRELEGRGYRLGLVDIVDSDNNCMENLRIFGLLPHFSSVGIVPKTTKAAYRDFIRDLGSIPSRTAVVDNHITHGVAVGNELGCTTFLVKTGTSNRKNPGGKNGQPTYTIKTTEDVLEYLPEIE